MAFWAPFLLLHLGGPDTITAYSLEDNELWLRHLLGLVVQELLNMGRGLGFSGLLSSQHFRKSLLPRPDPGPNYAKFMEEYMLKETEGFELSWRKFVEKMLSKVIGVELGFVYDVLYTKAAVIYSIWGGLLRCTSLSSTVIAFMAFCAIDWHEKSKSASDFRVCKQLCSARGDRVLQNNWNCLNDLSWSVEVEFDHSILLWHIATDLCHHSEKDQDPVSVLDLRCETSKLLSDYMLYILVKRPNMLPNGIERIRFPALSLPKHCNCCKVRGNGIMPRKWEMMSHVWLEILSYAASKCMWNHHAQQLRHGGELLTHVWLLMAHLGITEQFQISQGHARTKLACAVE
ncbi:transmembrane protein, putative [Actinidia rufa]|uniref:Transmembrane protein, putative n=1 Tax=Actinidia rufa TaxID=165716 RepID=A0A7J0H3U1_9ERIC|nr:transmembrane protein, putative [Actinidia rufa]